MWYLINWYAIFDRFEQKFNKLYGVKGENFTRNRVFREFSNK